MADIPTSNQPFSSEEIKSLVTIADHIIPKDEKRNLPSASDVEFLDALTQGDPTAIQSIKEEISSLNERSLGGEFNSLSKEERSNLLESIRVDEPRFLYRFAAHIYMYYYQDSRVLTQIGLEARAPFPKGFTSFVKRGDLSLLDPVRARGSICRSTD